MWNTALQEGNQNQAWAVLVNNGKVDVPFGDQNRSSADTQLIVDLETEWNVKGVPVNRADFNDAVPNALLKGLQAKFNG